MSKSYFEQRIFGQNTPEAASEQAPETSVGAQPQPALQQPAPSDAVPSQPYRFGAAARGEHPPIASQAYEDRVQQQEWSAAEELRSRIGMSHRERARLERSLQWEPASDADILPEDDKGRFAVTQTATDEYVFRAGPLRNIARTAPYFHSGQVWDLEQAVAIMGSSQLGVELDGSQVSAITAFLHTLTGEQPEVAVPILPASTQDTPRPE